MVMYTQDTIDIQEKREYKEIYIYIQNLELYLYYS